MTPIAIGEARLLPALACTLEQLLLQLTDLLRARGSRARLAAELALCSSRLAQLAQFLPAAHTVRQQVSHVDKLLPALLQPQETAVQIRLLVPLWRLLQILPAGLPDLAPWRRAAAARPAAIALMASWWRSQQLLAAAPFSAALHDLMRQLATVVRSGAPEPAAIAVVLRRWQVLQTFGGDSRQLQHSADLLQRITLVLLMPAVTTAADAGQCWLQLWRLTQQQKLPAGDTSSCDDLALLQAVQTDLNRHRCQLQPFLQQAVAQPDTVLLPQPLVMLHYRLPWLLQAAGQYGLARLAHLWQRGVLLHWQLRRPLTPSLIALLAGLSALLDMSQWRTLAAMQITDVMLQLLQQWPSPQPHGVASVPLCIGKAPASIPLAGVPDLLAQSFVVLNRADETWFISGAAFACHAAAIAAELQLLEQGAAAVKVQAVERFCSLLLALQHKASQPMQQRDFPAQLLWRGHCHLLELLDEAAAWQDPQVDPQLMAELQTWQQRGVHEPLPPWSEPGAPAGMTLDELAQRLSLFVDKLAETLEHPLRFSMSIAPALPSTLLPLCDTCLQPLLRFLVLEQLQETTLRRQAHRPLAISLHLRLDVGDDGVMVELREDGCERAPDHQALKRLRHKLPPSVQRLLWRTLAGSGRSLYCVIGE